MEKTKNKTISAAEIEAEAASVVAKVKSENQATALASAVAEWKDNTKPYRGWYFVNSPTPDTKFKNILDGITRETASLYCNGDMAKFDAFFKDANNWKSIVDAYIKFGMVSGYYNSGSFWESSTCDVRTIPRFYYYANQAADLGLKYPPLDITKKNNCYFLKEALVKFEAEKSNLATLYGISSSEYAALIDKISQYNAYDSQMICGQYIIDQNKAELKKQTDILSKKAEQSALRSFQITTGDGKEDKTKKYITYGAVGLAAVVFLVVLVKKLKS